MSRQLRDSQWDKNNVLATMLSKIELPKMAKIEQRFDNTRIDDIPTAITKQFQKPNFAGQIQSNDKIAITVGSRGIANITEITKAIVDNVKSKGGIPFVIPAMGSHGGATAEGQKEIIEGLGVTEKSIGAPIISSMEVVRIGTSQKNRPVYLDKHAMEADGIIVAGRIKPHTAFRGEYESGLFKMLVIGLGKQFGAELCHNEGFGKMAENIPDIARTILTEAPIIMGVAIVENAFDDTCIIEAIPPEKIEEAEPALLQKAKSLMPHIKFPEFDILIIDEIGKNFSGAGMDPNITGRYCTPYASGGPVVQRYVVLDSSEETHGNAVGIGAADFSTKRLFDKYDFDAAYVNAMTALDTQGAFLPIVLINDKLAIAAAVHAAIDIDKNNPRIVRINNTSHIDEIYISESLEDEAKGNPEIRFLEEYQSFDFDEAGNLF